MDREIIPRNLNKEIGIKFGYGIEVTKRSAIFIAIGGVIALKTFSLLMMPITSKLVICGIEILTSYTLGQIEIKDQKIDELACNEVIYITQTSQLNKNKR